MEPMQKGWSGTDSLQPISEGSGASAVLSEESTGAAPTGAPIQSAKPPAAVVSERVRLLFQESGCHSDTVTRGLTAQSARAFTSVHQESCTGTHHSMDGCPPLLQQQQHPAAAALLLSSRGSGEADALPAGLRDGSAFARACRSMDGGRRPALGDADVASPKMGGALDVRGVQRSVLDDMMAPMMSRSISDALQEG